MENNETKLFATQSMCAILTSQMYMVKHMSQCLFTVSEQLLLAPQFILWMSWFNKSMYTNHSSLLFRKCVPTYTILPENHSSLLLYLLHWATDNQVCIVLFMQAWIHWNSYIITNHEIMDLILVMPFMYNYTNLMGYIWSTWLFHCLVRVIKQVRPFKWRMFWLSHCKQWKIWLLR